ncbi:hypothetical protein CEP88_06385 [Roseobacter denitrificans]|nr:hypothetical protein CEP88_06385 [Roseobacter denitrificans]
MSPAGWADITFNGRGHPPWQPPARWRDNARLERLTKYRKYRVSRNAFKSLVSGSFAWFKFFARRFKGTWRPLA